MRRSPRTLLLHLAAELLRLLAVTTGVLVLVLSFAAGIKFLADGKLAASDAPLFMAVAAVPMLAYALPFAACFASTLVYHRLAADNEAQAAGASGISHRTLLLPAALVGVLLAAALALLNEQVIPRFWRSMQGMITLDAARMLVNAVARGESLALGNRWVYAEDALRLPPDASTPAGVERFALSKAVLVEFDASGRPLMQGTAELVYVTLTRDDRTVEGRPTAMTRVQFVAKNLVGRDRDRAMVRVDQTPFAAEIPDAFEDDPKFLTFSELRDLRVRPQALNFIDRRHRNLALETARLRAVDDLQRAARERGEIVLKEPDGRTVRVKTAGLVHAAGDPPGVYRVEPPAGMRSLSIERSALVADAAGSAAAMRVEAPSLRLQAAAPDPASNSAASLPARAPTATLAAAVQFRFDAPEARMFARSGEGEIEQGTRIDWTLSGLLAPAAALTDLLALDVPGLLAAADRAAADTRGDATPVRNAADDLRRKERDLQNEVTSKQHERWAQSVCCLLMILTGAIVALRHSQSQPLTVYLWSFLPALLCYITIAGGQQTTHGSGPIGLVLLWAGVAALALYTFLAFRIVARH
jgi:lipopolysaccharide export LptBFGC system permease protein LptF